MNWLIEYVNEHNTELEKSIVNATKKATEATDAAKAVVDEINETSKRFCTLKTVGDFLYFVAPVAVLIDMLLRLIGLI